jgi:hypothetical protein
VSQVTAAKEIVRIAAQTSGPCVVINITPHMTDPSEYQAGFDYAQRMGWVDVVGIGHFELTAAGRAAAPP